MEKAIFELNEKLRHPSDIESKIETILTRSRDENTKYLEWKHSLCLSGIENIKDALFGLREIKETIWSLSEAKSECEKQLKAPDYAIKDFKTIRDLSTAYFNFTNTKKFLECLGTDDTIKEEDIEKFAALVYEKDELACDIRQYSYELNSEEQRVVERKLNELKRISLEFTSSLLQMAKEPQECVGAFEALDRIIQKEEQRNNIVKQVLEGESTNDPVVRQNYLEHTRYINFEPKNIQDRFVSSMKSGISHKFHVLMDDNEFLTKLSFIFDDLKKLNGPCLSFFKFDDFIREYHNGLKKLFDHKVANLQAEFILGIIEFKSFYYRTMQDDFGRVPESVGPKLISNDQELMNMYAEFASARLKQWIEKILAIEIQKFVARDPEIAKDEEGKLVSSGFINLLQMIKAQLEPITFNKKVFINLVDIIKMKCESFNKSLHSAMQTELKNVLASKGLHGFEDYCIMFGNSGLRLTQYISTLSFFQCDEVRELQQIFLDILRNANDILCEYILYTCRPALTHLFRDDWVSGKHRKTFIVTIDDFLQDYMKSMSDYTFTTFICDLCRKVYYIYRDLFKSGKVPLSSRLSETMKKDIEGLYKLFLNYRTEDDFKDFIILPLKLCPLIEVVDAELFLVEAKTLILSDEDITRSFIENVLSRKKDMEEPEKAKVIRNLSGLFSSIKGKPKSKN